MIRKSLFALLVVAAVLSSVSCFGQIVNPIADQAPPVLDADHNFLQTHSLNETINPATGAVSLKVTAPVAGDRGEGVDFAFEYNSNSAHHGQNWFGNAAYLGAGGWSYTVPSLSVTKSMGTLRPGTNPQTSGAGGTTQGCNYFTGYNMTDLKGTMHGLGLTALEQQSDCSSIYYPNENQYLTGGDATTAAYTTTIPYMNAWIPPVTVSDGDGTVYQFASPTHQYPGDNTFATSEWISVPPPYTGVATSIEDRNGNVTNISDAGNGNITVTDTLGRAALTINGFGALGKTTTVSVPGMNPYQVSWINQEFNKTWNVKGIVPADAGTSPGQPNCRFGGQIETQPGTIYPIVNSVDAFQPEISTIVLPNGQSYQFVYDSPSNGTGTGLLSKVIYPDGAVVNYTWTINQQSSYEVFGDSNGNEGCEAIFDTPALASKVVMFDGHTPALEQDYTYSTTWGPVSPGSAYQKWTSKQTTVVTKDRIRGTSYETVYNYLPVYAPSLGNANVYEGLTGTGGPYNPGESTIQYFGDLGQTLLKTVTKNYWDYWAQPSDVKTTLDNGQTSEVQSCFEGPATYPSGSLCSNQGGSLVLSANLLVDEYDFDYGNATNSASTPGAVGSLLKHTHVDYNSFTTPLYPSVATILDRPKDVQIFNGSGTEMSETDYAYDNGSVTQVAATQHDEADFQANPPVCPSSQPNCPATPATPYQRGNVTTKTARCFGCPQGDSVTQYAWYETGQLKSKTDANGNTTQYSYVDNFASDDANEGGTSSATNGYLTGITNALGQTESFQYAYNDGALRSITGLNGEVTHYYYSHAGVDDPLRRFKESDVLDSSGTLLDQSLVGYSDTPYPPTITTQKKLDSSHYVTTVATADGMGHVYKTQLTTDPSGTDETDTTYDGLAHPYIVTNPFRSTTDLTYGQSTTQYDALGRVTSITKQDGSQVTTSYSGPSTTVTDELGNQRRSITDAMGRLIEVDEPGDPQPATPATATLNITGNGLKSYTYAATDSTATVTINGTEQSKVYYVGAQNTPQTVYDQGTISITVNGCNSGNVTYAQASTGTSLATALAGQINGSCGSYVSATSSGAVISLTSKTGGTAGNYSVSGTSATSVTQGPYGEPGFSGPSFTPSASGSTLAGGTNSRTVYDYGTLTVTIGSWTSAPVSYGENGSDGGNDTDSMLMTAMTALNTELNASSSPVTAAIVSGSIQLTEKTPGSAANGTAVTINSTSSNSALFGSGSFGGNATMLGGGWNGGSTLVVPYVTRYQYDVLGNLLCVEQHGDSTSGIGCSSYPTPTANDPWRPRMFTYDSLSHLLTAYNPETGNISYTYDANGNEITKTDARGITAIYSRAADHPIDALNRVTKVTFSNNDPAITYTYGQGTNGIGRRTSMTDASGSTAWSYDATGHVLSETRTINPGPGFNPVTNTVSYLWPYGNLTQITYPNGTQVQYALDNAGRDLSAIDTTHSINYATSATYAPNSSIAGFNEQAGGTITNSFLYNPRLQICREIASTTGTVPQSCTDTTHTGNVMDFQYDFHLGNKDNGNLYTAANNKDTTRTQAFTYDSKNRLLTANTSGTDCTVMVPGSTTQTKYWAEGYTYDAWANLTAKASTHCSAETTPLAVNYNNQLSAAGYDAAGNMINNGGGAYVYDGESQLVSAGGFTYIYDGDGNRVAKTNGSTGTLYWYGQGGILLETDLTGNPQSEYVFFGGQRVARRDVSTLGSPVYYYFSNQIHSTALITDASGDVEDDADYYPWGGLVQYSNNVANHYWFSGKERDAETGLDYFGARYYGNTMGRFLTPDWSAKVEGVPYADFHDPQSLNLYGYVRDNPITKVDPDGHCLEDACVLEIAALAAWAGSPAGQETLDMAGKAIGAAAVLGTAAIAGVSHWGDGLFHRKTSNQAPPPASTGSKKADQIRTNNANGKAAEKKVVEATKQTDTNVQQELTIKTKSGLKTRVDVVSTTPAGKTRLQEVKSGNAQLNPNQAAAHPEIEASGGTVAGNGKPGFPGGTQIPPTKVEVVRPPQ